MWRLASFFLDFDLELDLDLDSSMIVCVLSWMFVLSALLLSVLQILGLGSTIKHPSATQGLKKVHEMKVEELERLDSIVSRAVWKI